MISEDDAGQVRGRVRSQSFRSQEEEMTQRGVLNPESNQAVQPEIKNSTENVDLNVPGSNKKLTEDNRRESSGPMISPGSNGKNFNQIRDINVLSQKTIDSVRILQQDPAKMMQQMNQKSEAELAEEELERSNLSKGFLTPTQYDYYVKILLLGDSGVGKSSLMMRFADDKFQENLIGTAGVDFKVKYLEKKGIKTKCQLWDTAGQEKFHTITKSYYRGAHGIALVYDCCDRKSFEKLSYWMENIKNEANDEVFLVLLANKIDKGDRDVTYEEGKIVAEKHGFQFFETSAKSGLNVVKSFETLSDLVVVDLQQKEEKHKEKGNSLTPLRAQQRNMIQTEKRCACCVIS